MNQITNKADINGEVYSRGCKKWIVAYIQGQLIIMTINRTKIYIYPKREDIKRNKANLKKFAEDNENTIINCDFEDSAAYFQELDINFLQKNNIQRWCEDVYKLAVLGGLEMTDEIYARTLLQNYDKPDPDDNDFDMLLYLTSEIIEELDRIYMQKLENEIAKTGVSTEQKQANPRPSRRTRPNPLQKNSQQSTTVDSIEDALFTIKLEDGTNLAFDGDNVNKQHTNNGKQYKKNGRGNNNSNNDNSKEIPIQKQQKLDSEECYTFTLSNGNYVDPKNSKDSAKDDSSMDSERKRGQNQRTKQRNTNIQQHENSLNNKRKGRPLLKNVNEENLAYNSGCKDNNDTVSCDIPDQEKKNNGKKNKTLNENNEYEGDTFTLTLQDGAYLNPADNSKNNIERIMTEGNANCIRSTEKVYQNQYGITFTADSAFTN